METSINNNEAFGAFLIDLPKVSDCLGHDLKIAKLHSHGLSSTSLRLLSDYLSNCKQQIKVENLFSKWEKHWNWCISSVTIGPLLLNIFVCDMFLIFKNTYFESYADDNTPYTVNQNTDSVSKPLLELYIQFLCWFKESKLKLNLHKWQLIVNGTENTKIKLANVTITNSKKKKFLGITFDDKLKFQYHIENLCTKASLKLSILLRVVPFANLSQK